MEPNEFFWISLQMRVVGDLCNFACSYCPYGLETTSKQMTDEVLQETTRKVLEHNMGSSVFCWHGGEPILAGIKFFEQAMGYQAKWGKANEIVNQIQTNGSLLTHEFACFFKENRFSVGISLDGPEFIHNAIRVNKGGLGTYKNVVQGFETLRNAGLEPSVIATVGQHSLAYPREILRHLAVDLGVKSIHFSVVFSAFPKQELAINNESWYAFLRDIFHEWYEIGDPDIEIRELTEVIAWLSGKANPCCTSLGTCPHWFVIDANGNIYPCEVLERKRHYGNILIHDFNDVLNTPQHRELIQIQSYKPKRCLDCEFLDVCNNGCTNMRIANGKVNPLGHYAYCEQRLALFKDIKATFESALESNPEGGDEYEKETLC